MIAELTRELEALSPARIVEVALARFGASLVISFSGAEDVLLIEYAHQSKRPYRVVSLDTGRLHPETYRFLDQVEKHYGIRIEYCFPDAREVQALVRHKGLFSFYEDGHGECCGIRKVAPLRKHLAGVDAWITGQRRDQSPGTRSAVAVAEQDDARVKFNPLWRTTSAEVWAAIRAFDVPYNPLHEKGFVSIGCEPCTRAILPREHERAGRWWWEEETKKECGLHRPPGGGSDG